MLEALSLEQLQAVDMLVFGEKTYAGMADYWSNTSHASDAKVAPLMNSIAKIVCSPSLTKADWNNATIVRDAVTEIAELKYGRNGPLYVFGSANLSHSLLSAGLFDEIRLCIAPIILGKGRRLFEDQTFTRKLGLLEAKALSTGGVLVRYDCQN